MEPEVKAFLIRIMYSVIIGFVWMALNSTFGIMFGFAFFDNGFGIGNLLFYIWFIASIILMLWLYVKLWKKSLE